MIIVLVGVSGTGKTTIGQLLAERLGWEFLDADDYHPVENIAKMAAGSALNDDDRRPWLDILRNELYQRIKRGESAVLACSALKQKYRTHLNPDSANVFFVHLQGSYELILQRMQQRKGHYMKADLLRSQFADLECFGDGLRVSVDQVPADIAKQIAQDLALDNQFKTQTLVDGLMFPEAPRWHQGELWFTDQHAQQVLRVSEKGNLTEVAKTPDLPGGLAFFPDGTALVVLMTQRKVCRINNGQLEDYADVSGLASFHCNDMIRDEAGHLWVGNFGFDLHGGADISPAEIVLIKENGKAEIVADNVIFPNGMVVLKGSESIGTGLSSSAGADKDNDDISLAQSLSTPTPDTLLVAETFAARITAFDIAVDGKLLNQRLWADLNGAYPDGICLAKNGSLWIASPNIKQVIQVAEGGKVLNRIETKGRPYACMLGGKNGDWLYITSSETDDPAEAKVQRSGRIEMAGLC